jgi:RimJ/RimL family protein N-acetyltransferase
MIPETITIYGSNTRIVNIKGTTFYIIVDQKLCKPIGFLGIDNNELIGLYIDEEFRNKGYATDTINAIVKTYPSINITTHIDNISMQNLLEKLGFSKWLKYFKD